jgi:co-chaperonin GroES (HSP10)
LDRVLVQRIKAETKTASGIFLPEASVKELNEAKVLAVGPGALSKDGARVPMGVSQGDRVLIPQVSLPITIHLDTRNAGKEAIVIRRPASAHIIHIIHSC